MTDQRLPSGDQDLRGRAIARLKRKRDFGAHPPEVRNLDRAWSRAAAGLAIGGASSRAGRQVEV